MRRREFIAGIGGAAASAIGADVRPQPASRSAANPHSLGTAVAIGFCDPA